MMPQKSEYPYGIFDRRGVLVANFKTLDLAQRCVMYFGSPLLFYAKKYC